MTSRALAVAATLAWSLVGFACAKTHLVVPIRDATEGDYIYYALPRTVVSATILVSISSVDQSPPCAGSDEMKELGLEAPKVASGKFFTVHEITLTKYSEADPAARFAIALDSAGSDELGVSMNVAGALTKGSSESTDVVVPIVVGATQFVASIAGKVLFGAPTIAGAPAGRCDRARLALQEVRGRLLDLDSSQGAADSKEVLELKTAKLTVAAKALEAPFTGVTAGKPQRIVCQLRPAEAGETRLFDWSKAGGVGGSRQAGCEVPESLSIAVADRATGRDATEKARLTETHSLSLRIVAKGTDLSQITPTVKETERSFFYRIPAFAELEVGDTTSNSEWVRKSDRVTWPIAQLGKIYSLPRLCATKNAKVSAILDAETGALLEASARFQEADLGPALAAIGTSTAGVLQAHKEAQRDEELLQLQREQALLEARVAIKVAKEALGEE